MVYRLLQIFGEEAFLKCYALISAHEKEMDDDILFIDDPDKWVMMKIWILSFLKCWEV